MKSKRPTLRDVAREANVSYQTVSRVINDQDHVSPLTRSRVQKAINNLGFHPNRAAQIMQTERSHTIEVILFYSGFNNFLYEMARASQQAGYHFSVSAITEEEFVPTLESQFRDARFVEFAQSFFFHSIKLLLRRGGERENQFCFFAEIQRDAGILRRVGRGKETGVVAVLHVFAVRLKNPRVRAGMRKHFA